ncbi:protein of unknown function [Brevefilum fermentans]|uniref:Uncharacterized protein n=1 Tax=Candidatus Brevifilum fermentans TaxID=1986204 RepID=A0A1Y6K588_9CHLR|nr:protein of unknown function [Brevefilum fermentans]
MFNIQFDLEIVINLKISLVETN